ncbi:MAG: hypothetical protein ACOH1P_08200 [Lysobacter sp.]
MSASNIGSETVLIDGDTGTRYSIPFIDVQGSQAVDFGFFALICGAVIVLYIFLLLRSRRPLTDNVHNIVVVVFNIYGIAVCVNVINKAYNFVWRFEFVNSVGEEARLVIPQMGVDELVLIFIGSVAVALILSDQVVRIVAAPWKEHRERNLGSAQTDPGPAR